jgi:hypothetical protein
MSIKLNFWIDTAIFTGFMIAMEPHFTGETIHEWFTVAAAGTLLVHFVLHWDWFVRLTSRFFVRVFHSSRLNYLIAVAIFLGFLSIMLSGLLISDSFVPALGIRFEARHAWRRIHELASELTLILVAVHVALRWDWIQAAFLRILVEPFRNTKKVDPVLLEEDGL